MHAWLLKYGQVLIVSFIIALAIIGGAVESVFIASICAAIVASVGVVIDLVGLALVTTPSSDGSRKSGTPLVALFFYGIGVSILWDKLIWNGILLIVATAFLFHILCQFALPVIVVYFSGKK